MAQQIAYITRVTESQVVNHGPCILYRARPQVAVGGQYIEVYDGLDSTSGNLRDKIICDVNVPTNADYGPGAYFDRGLYVNIPVAGNAVTLVWYPCPRLNLD